MKTVLLMPDYRASNPYQYLLSEALGAAGAQVIFASFKGYWPILKNWHRNKHGLRAIHLHWTDAAIDSPSRIKMALKAIRILLEVATVRALGVRVVYTAHNLFSHRERISRRIESVFYWMLLRLCNRVLVHTVEATGLLIETFGLAEQARNSKFMLVPHGNFIGAYPTAGTREGCRSALSLGKSDLVFMIFGDLRHNKGVQEFSEAFSRWDAPDARLLIVGKVVSPQLADCLNRLSQQDSRFRLSLGFVEATRVGEYFAAADVVCFPYASLLTSGAMILAMSMAKPLLLPKSTTMASVVDEPSQFSYTPGCYSDALEAVRQAGHERLVTIGRQNLMRAQGMTWENHAGICMKAYGLAKAEAE